MKLFQNKKRYSPLALLFLLTASAKAYMLEVLAYAIIFLCVAGSIYEVTKIVKPLRTQQGGTANTTATVFGTTQTYFYPNWPPQFLYLGDPASIGPVEQVQSLQFGPTHPFTFQYWFSSTNATQPAYSQVGSNLTITIYHLNDDPAGTNNSNWQLYSNSYPVMTILYYAQNDSNNYEYYYEAGGWLNHFTATNTMSANPFITNSFVQATISRSTDNVNWTPIFNQPLVGADIPYTFTDPFSPTSNAFYRVTYQ